LADRQQTNQAKIDEMSPEEAGKAMGEFLKAFEEAAEKE
jgi:hypothetical protein